MVEVTDSGKAAKGRYDTRDNHINGKYIIWEYTSKKHYSIKSNCKEWYVKRNLDTEYDTGEYKSQVQYVEQCSYPCKPKETFEPPKTSTICTSLKVESDSYGARLDEQSCLFATNSDPLIFDFERTTFDYSGDKSGVDLRNGILDGYIGTISTKYGGTGLAHAQLLEGTYSLVRTEGLSADRLFVPQMR